MIYTTGGNDNTVAVWDLTEHPADQPGIPAISNGTSKLSQVVAVVCTS